MVAREVSLSTVSGTLAGITTCPANMVMWSCIWMSLAPATSETRVESQFTGDWDTMRQRTFFMWLGGWVLGTILINYYVIKIESKNENPENSWKIVNCMQALDLLTTSSREFQLIKLNGCCCSFQEIGNNGQARISW